MKLFWIVIIASIFAACGADPERTPDKARQEFFPVRSFIEGQVHLVDSFQMPVTKYITANNRTDSILITLKEFRSLATEFMYPDITDPSLKKFYTESNFADQSIPSITFTYSATSTNMIIQRLDVLIEPDPIQSDKVKSIYIEKASMQKNIPVFKKLYWKANREFQIITTTATGNQPPSTILLKVTWE